jgi:hypothetical protein
MSQLAEEIPLSTTEMPLPWLVEPCPVEDPTRDLTTSSVEVNGITSNAQKRSSAQRSPSATPSEHWANISHESRTATPSHWPTGPAVTQPQPQQGLFPYQPTTPRTATTVILLLVALGALTLIIILVILAGGGHSGAFSGAHALHGVRGMAR